MSFDTPVAETMHDDPGPLNPSFSPTEAAADRSAARLSRREFLAGLGLVAGVGALGAKQFWDYNEGFQSASVAVVKAESYDDRLEEIVRRGLESLGIDPAWAKGKSILLKPNLVEPRKEAPHVNTHPAIIRSVAEVFRRWDAREVFVAEGQGHCRDWRLVLEESGLGPVLKEAGIEYVDLNHDDLFAVENRLGFTDMRQLYLPVSLKRADLVVSLAKMKTHHWAGATLSMKNLFGVLPGIAYGWPKNVLHVAGIPQSILDITAAVAPNLAIIDGIVGMEGDGPIMGTPKRANLLVMGTNLPAADATAVRLMGLDPSRIAYLRSASGRLGPIGRQRIEQRGEPIGELAQRFELVDHPSMKQFRG